MADVTMPQLGETVTEGTITRWAKTVGDRIDQDEVLFEVSTDKVDSEVPSPAAGYVAEILVEEGATVDVGTRLAVITEQAPSDGSGGAPAPASPQTEAPPAPAPATEEAAPSGTVESPAPAAPAPPATPPPAPEAPAAPPSDQRPSAAPAGENGQAPVPVPAAPPDGEGREGEGSDVSQVLSPVVRRLLAEHQLDPAAIRGTGAGGRITRSDVLAAVDARGAAPAPAAAPAAPPPQAPAPPAAAPPAAAPAPPAPAVRAGGDDEVIPFSNIRRRTAEHMVRSKATSAHTLTAVEVDFHRVDAARATVKDAFRESEGFSLTYLPFIARAVVDALEDFPRLNASVGQDSLIVHRRVNLGVAVDLDLEGLIVPVVRDADSKRLRAVAREVRELAERARTKKLTADEIAGGTFTITNPGPYGTFLTVPIINQPQVAILSTDGIKRRPVVAELAGGGEGIVIHPVGMLALSFDHRAVDGAYASAFLARCRDILETRDWVQEL